MESTHGNVFTVGMFHMDTVKIHESAGVVSGITISGSRRTLLKADKGGYLLSAVDFPMKFEVMFQTFDDAELTNLPLQLFYPNGVAAA